MNACGRPRGGWMAGPCLGALSLVALVVLAANPAAAQAKSPGDHCKDMLEQQYGAASVGGLYERHSGQRRQRKAVYADVTLANGQTARVRCRVSAGGISTVQTYLPRGMGSATPGSSWVDAEGVLPAGPGKPDEPDSGAPAEAGADQAKPDSSGDATETPAGSETAEAPTEPQFGQRKRAPGT